MSLCQSPVPVRVQPGWWKHKPFRCGLCLSAAGRPADWVKAASALWPGQPCPAESHKESPQSAASGAWHIVTLQEQATAEGARDAKWLPKAPLMAEVPSCHPARVLCC